MKLSVLMLVHDQGRALRKIVQRVLDAPIDGEIDRVAADDGTMCCTPSPSGK